ncbi:MAG: NifB/NifX family molybdenum-iron cluster-binding protein [Chloroflexota bacterium]
MKILKIAAVTEDGEKLSSHFGMAQLYKIFSVEDGQVAGAVVLDKPHHKVHPDHSQHGHHDGHGHDLHEDMFAPIRDCQVLLVGGMGQGAFNRAQSAGLEIVFVGGSIDQAVQDYLSGKLVSDARRLHIH